jgi:hypothetical protein
MVIPHLVKFIVNGRIPLQPQHCSIVYMSLARLHKKQRSVKALTCSTALHVAVDWGE